MEGVDFVATFMDITGTDDTVALQMLQASDWQLEPALQLFFAEGAGDGPSGEVPRPISEAGAAASPYSPYSQQAASASDALATSSSKLETGKEYVRPPLPVKREALYDDLPMYRAHQIAQADRPRATVDAFRNFSEEAEERVRQQIGDRSAESEAGPPKDALAALFRPPFDITFQGTIEQAKTEGTSKNKWLLVNVQSNSEFASHTMNRDTWAHDAVKETVGSYFIFWQVYDDTEEGQKICTYYKLSNMPVTMVLDPQTGQKLRAWDGMINAARLLEDVIPFMDRGPLDRKGPKRPRDSVAPNTTAIAASDRADSNEPLQARDVSMEAPLPTPASGHQNEDAQTSTSLLPTEKPLELPPLPEEPSPSTASCRIAVRFPNGSRAQRYFLLSDPAKYLRTFCCQQVAEAAGGRQFRLAPMVPGAASLHLDTETSVKDLGLANSILAMTWV